MFGQLQRDVEGLIDEAIELSYYMRGALGYEEILCRTPGERQRITKFIERRLENESKKHFPVY